MSMTRVVGVGTGKAHRGNRIPTKAAQAERARGLDEVRVGNPLQVDAKLCEMERAGLIFSGIVEDADDDLVGTLDAEEEKLSDCEIDLADEDAFDTSDWSYGESQTCVCGNGEWVEENSAFDPVRKFSVNIHRNAEGQMSCSVEKDMRIGFDHDSPEAADILAELSARYEVLSRLGDWLAAEHGRFLQTGDWWDYAEKALDEAKGNQLSVVQKDLIDIAAIRCRGSRCGADSFSRFIRNAVLSWGSNGSMDIGCLFSKEARCAWVARGYYEFCRRNRTKDMKAALKTLSDCIVKREEAVARRKSSILSMSNEWAAARLCSLAHVKGKDVAVMYGQRILEG